MRVRRLFLASAVILGAVQGGAAQTADSARLAPQAVESIFGIRAGYQRVGYPYVGLIGLIADTPPQETPRSGYLVGGMWELGRSGGRVRFRGELTFRHHRQSFLSGYSPGITLRTYEIAVSPLLLVRVARLPVYVLVGCEVAKPVRARVRGEAMTDIGDRVSVDEPFRPSGWFDGRITAGVTGQLTRALDLTFRGTAGSDFYLDYVPYGYGMHTRYAGFEVSAGYRLGRAITP